MNVNEGTSITYDKDGKEIARGRQTAPNERTEKKIPKPEPETAKKAKSK